MVGNKQYIEALLKVAIIHHLLCTYLNTMSRPTENLSDTVTYYNQEDFSKWDTYTAIEVPKTNLVPNYAREFRKVADKNYNAMYQSYRYLNNKEGNYFLLDRLLKGYPDNTAVAIWTSFSINSAYNRTANRQEWDALADSAVKETMAWFENYWNTFFSAMIMTHDLDPVKKSDLYGIMKLTDGFNKNYTVGASFWTVHAYLPILIRFAHLCSNEFLQKIRINIDASMVQLYTSLMLSNGLGIQGSTAQWSQRIGSVVLHASFLQRSEKVLLDRKQPIANGYYTVPAILELADKMIKPFIKQMTSYGFAEFITSYYSYTLDIMLKVLLHAPTLQIYQQFNSIWKRLWQDIILNYSYTSNCISGSMGRMHSPLHGVGQGLDKNFLDQFVQPYLTANSNTQVPISAKCEHSYYVHCYAMRVLSGVGYVPDDLLQSITSDKLCRTVIQRFSEKPGQERYNYITPNYTMGHSGENMWSTSHSSQVVVRLCGARNRMFTLTRDTYVNVVCPVHFLVESTDNPCFNVALDSNLTARQIVDQVQNKMLVTQLVAPSSNISDRFIKEFPYSLNTNLLLPLTIDNLSANGTTLPYSVGTSIPLPANSTFTINHRDSTIVVRLLTIDSNLPHAPSDAIMKQTPYPLGHQPYNLMWIVDADSYANGMGRVVVHHKNPEDTSTRPYYISWLIVVEDTPDLNGSDNLTRYIQSIQVSETVADKLDAKTLEAVSTWRVAVNVRGTDLAVARTDRYSTRSQVNNGVNMVPYETINLAPRIKFTEGEDAYRCL